MRSTVRSGEGSNRPLFCAEADTCSLFVFVCVWCVRACLCADCGEKIRVKEKVWSHTLVSKTSLYKFSILSGMNLCTLIWVEFMFNLKLNTMILCDSPFCFLFFFNSWLSEDSQLFGGIRLHDMLSRFRISAYQLLCSSPTCPMVTCNNPLSIQ